MLTKKRKSCIAFPLYRTEQRSRCRVFEPDRKRRLRIRKLFLCWYSRKRLWWEGKKLPCWVIEYRHRRNQPSEAQVWKRHVLVQRELQSRGKLRIWWRRKRWKYSHIRRGSYNPNHNEFSLLRWKLQYQSCSQTRWPRKNWGSYCWEHFSGRARWNHQNESPTSVRK